MTMEKDKEAYLGTPSKLDTTYKPKPDRYGSMIYRRCGKSGLKLPVITLGLWQNFGDEASYSNARKILLRAFDMGITHFDLANNYGNPPGSAERTLGRILREDLGKYRDELVISTKAGFDMWPGPYGEWGSKKYLVASLDQSLKRLGIDYVDIFYSHRFDPQTPLSETMGALDQIVKGGKALYTGISSYGAKETLEASRILSQRGTPLTINQSSYSLFNRWIEKQSLLDALGSVGAGCITFTALEQGLLSNKYINGADAVPQDSRMANPASLLKKKILSKEMVKSLNGLNEIAESRGQTLSQMAISWVLRNPAITSTVVGVKTVEQLEENVAAIQRLDFTKKELDAIDVYAKDEGITLWPPNC